MVSRDGCDLELEDELLPKVGTKRSVKERLGSQLDSDAVVSKRCFLSPSYLYMYCSCVAS